MNSKTKKPKWRALISRKNEASETPQHGNVSLEEDICIHIFVVSASLLGVCVMIIGIINGFAKTHIETIADDMLAADSVLFLTTCFLSYLALRARTVKRMHGLEQVADFLFLIGLSILAVTCLIITYAIV